MDTHTYASSGHAARQRGDESSRQGGSGSSEGKAEVRARIHLVGWSLGGMIAQELALMMMDRSSPPTTLTLACTHRYCNEGRGR